MSATRHQLDTLILDAVSALHPSAYGVTIVEWLREQKGRDVTLGTFYWRLDCLDRDGLVSTKYVEGGEERSGRRKLMVTLTEKGEALLATTNKKGAA